MADKTKGKQGGDASADQVILRDGSRHLGGPRPDPPTRPAKAPKEAQAGGKFAGRYTDRSYVGVRDERAAFEAAGGNPGPRGPEAQLEGKHDRVKPGDQLESGVPAPID